MKASNDLVRQCFDNLGLVKEVFIPSKLGELFSFVRFSEVKNLCKFQSSLEDVWMGSFKLRVNFARFSKHH